LFIIRVERIRSDNLLTLGHSDIVTRAGYLLFV